MKEGEEVNKVKTIILLIILIAIGGLVLYGEKDRYVTPKEPVPLKSLISSQK